MMRTLLGSYTSFLHLRLYFLEAQIRVIPVLTGANWTRKVQLTAVENHYTLQVVPADRMKIA